MIRNRKYSHWVVGTMRSCRMWNVKVKCGIWKCGMMLISQSIKPPGRCHSAYYRNDIDWHHNRHRKMQTSNEENGNNEARKCCWPGTHIVETANVFRPQHYQCHVQLKQTYEMYLCNCAIPPNVVSACFAACRCKIDDCRLENSRNRINRTFRCTVYSLRLN